MTNPKRVSVLNAVSAAPRMRRDLFQLSGDISAEVIFLIIMYSEMRKTYRKHKCFSSV